MAYISGRTVKSSRKARPTTVASATADARKLVNRHLPGVQGVTINSVKMAHALTLEPLVRTTITFPAMPLAESQALAEAIEALPSYDGMSRDIHGITFTRTI